MANPNPIIRMREEDSVNVINSLKKILEVDFEKAYGGHGVWKKQDVKTTLDNTLKLKKKVESLWRKRLSPEQIIDKVLTNVPEKFFK